eukprot:g39537.t1
MVWVELETDSERYSGVMKKMSKVTTKIRCKRENTDTNSKELADDKLWLGSIVVQTVFLSSILIAHSS